MSENVKILLYRAVQELLVNTAKHSNASEVDIVIDSTDNYIRIAVEDNGEGFDYSSLNDLIANKKKFGLFSIYQRLTYLGGRFSIETEKGSGVRAELLAPLNAKDN